MYAAIVAFRVGMRRPGSPKRRGEEPLYKVVLTRANLLKDTGGPSLLLVASALLFSVGVLFNAVVRRRI